MKHISVQEFWIRDEISKVKSIAVNYMPTADMPADILTKALPRASVQQHTAFMGLRDLMGLS